MKQPQQSTTKKRILYIDGSNLYGGLSELLRVGEYISFESLLKFIEQEVTVDEIHFYGTYMRIDPSKNKTYRSRVEAQKRFFDSAKAIKKVTFFKGHFSGSGKEKGIDVHLAVDMALGAALDVYDEAIIMTGDADLKYPVEKAKEFEKIVHLAAIGSRYPFGIASLVSKRIVLDIDGFFLKKVRPQYHGNLSKVIIYELRGNVVIMDVSRDNKNPTESAGEVPI